MFEALNGFDPSTITRQDVKTARATLARVAKSKWTTILSKGASNPKTAKSDARGTYLTAILYVAPHTIGKGCGNVCPKASAGCRAGCLYRAGNPVYMNVKERGRLARKQLLFQETRAFLVLLIEEIKAHIRKADKLGKIPCIRLNGTSDIAWERIAPWLFAMFPNVQFYDYTKDASRIGKTPRNYDLTFSRSECNDLEVGMVLARGGRVAVVVPVTRFRRVPAEWNGYRTEDGDTHDLTFTRLAQVVLLRAKGPACKDTTGFVDSRIENSDCPLIKLG